MGVIVDTSIFVRAERDGDPNAVGAIPVGQEIGVATITISELLEGMHHASSSMIAERRRRRVASMISTLPIFSFTIEIAETHARLRAELRRRGNMIGAHDLIIAATAVHLGWDVYTTDLDAFRRVPGLAVSAPPALKP